MPNNKLTDTKPSLATGGFEEFVSDPAKPVPYVEKVAIGMDRDYPVADQRFAGRRPDVLVYSTDVLTKDWTVAGPIDVELVGQHDRHRFRLDRQE